MSVKTRGSFIIFFRLPYVLDDADDDVEKASTAIIPLKKGNIVVVVAVDVVAVKQNVPMAIKSKEETKDALLGGEADDDSSSSAAHGEGRL